MKHVLKWPYRLTLMIIKCSGFVFFSIKDTRGTFLEFEQSWTHYGILFVSLAYSVYIAVLGQTQEIEFPVRSLVLSVAAGVLMTLTTISVIISKLGNFFQAQKGFSILKNLNWMDQQVSL